MGTPVDRTAGIAPSRPCATHRDDVFVFGLSFWNASYEDVRDWFDATLASEERLGLVLAFANANTLNHAAHSPRFRRALEEADVRVNDGIGFKLACRMRGVDVAANLNGSDLVPWLLRKTARPTSVFLFGATEESNAGAAAAVEALSPLVTVAGRLHGYVEDEEAEEAIRSSGAEIVLVGLGHPRQEIFCVERATDLGVKLAMPIGGLLDFLSETKPRAPMALRRRGLEWFYRLAIEPRRMFVRYMIGNPLFLARSAACARRDRALQRGTPQ